ncbi:unnamed protein product, partial [Lymnaea stagnalis]
VLFTVGFVGNVLNFLVFQRLGFHDTVNISMTALTLADLGSLVLVLWKNICYFPPFFKSDLPFVPWDIESVMGGWPRICLIRIAAMITAYVTLERCLCITLPLKVKAVLTPKRVTCILLSIVLIMVISVAPLLLETRFVFKFYSFSNKTLLAVSYTDKWEQTENTMLAFSTLYNLISFISIAIFTAILVRQLNINTKWPQAPACVGKLQTKSSKKERKASKMVTLISTLFIVCFFPGTVSLVCSMTSAEFRPGGTYFYVTTDTILASQILETINASSNMFIYVRMSSKFRKEFIRLLCGRQK